MDHRNTEGKGSLVLRSLGAGLALLLAAAFAVKLFVERDVHKVDEEATRIFNRVVLNEFDLKEVSLDDAIARLDATLAAAGRPGYLRFERWRGRDLPPDILIRETASHINPAPEQVADSQRLSTSVPFDLAAPVPGKPRLIPLARAVESVADSFGCITGQRGRTVLFIPAPDHKRHAFGPLITRTLIPPPMCGGPLYSPGTDLKPILERCGLIFYVGSEAMVLPNGRIRVRNTEEQLNRIGALMRARHESTTAQRFQVWSWDTFRRVDRWLLSL